MDSLLFSFFLTLILIRFLFHFIVNVHRIIELYIASMIIYAFCGYCVVSLVVCLKRICLDMYGGWRMNRSSETSLTSSGRFGTFMVPRWYILMVPCLSLHHHEFDIFGLHGRHNTVGSCGLKVREASYWLEGCRFNPPDKPWARLLAPAAPWIRRIR